MARPKKILPTYGTTVIKGITYYRTRITDADGKRVSLFARTPEELTAKKEEAERQIADTEHNRPVISTELKTKAARRDVPIPPQLVSCLKAVKEKSTSPAVAAKAASRRPIKT